MKKNSRRDFIRKAAILPLFPSAIPHVVSAFGVSAIKPPALKPGDTVAIASPAGAVWDEKQVQVFISILEKLQLKVETGATIKKKFGYFSGTDEARAKELNGYFRDNSIKGIFCMKGGWGCARILDLLDYSLIKANPKPLMGFSDITSLLIAINARTGLVTFHGPVGNSGWNEFSSAYVQGLLIKKEAALLNTGPKPEDAPVVFTPGKAKGVLVGGNLSVVASIIGSKYLPDWSDKILFLEETSEEPYRIDRMLTQLKLAGVLGSIRGLVFGKCVKCEAEEPEKAFTFMQVLEQHLKPLGIPAFYGAMIGHIENKLTVPIGINAEMNAEKGTIQLLESAVS